MNASSTIPAYRAISIVALLQAGVVVGGTLFVAAMLKAHGYKGCEVPDTFFNSTALFVRHSGFAVLLLPVLWTCLAVIIAPIARRPRLLSVVLLFGIAAILFGIYGYLIVGFNPTVL